MILMLKKLVQGSTPTISFPNMQFKVANGVILFNPILSLPCFSLIIQTSDEEHVKQQGLRCEQGLSQDLDTRVSKMDFGGDRVSW